MNQKAKTDHLTESLQSFETNLVTPVVPGELATWIAAVRASCEHVGEALRAEQTAHKSMFDEMRKQDPELLPRVEDLRQEDEEIRGVFDSLLRKISALARLPAEQVENRPAGDEQISHVSEQGLALIRRVRTQEAAVSTWHMEAFQRDRGLGD